MHLVFEELPEKKRFGGIETATRELAESLEKHDVRVTRGGQGVSIEGKPMPSCVHIHGIWSPRLSLRILQWRRRQIPCVVTVHGMLEPWAFANKVWKKRIGWMFYQRRILNMVQALHVTSSSEANNLRQLGLKPRIDTIPWGINTKKWAGDSLAENLPRKNESFSRSHQRTVLFVGRIYPVKGLPMLVEAWRKVRPVGWKMKIVGTDEASHLRVVEGLVRQAGLEDEFEFAGELRGRELSHAFQAADLFILPSHSENFGMVVGEALGYACPVIATQGCPWSGLEKHDCGWWPRTSVSDIAKALRMATSMNSVELRQMGLRGQKWIEDEFSWDSTTRQMITLYRSVIGANREAFD